MQLLHGDCLELMKEMPDNSVDLVLCDLPYGTTRNKWDNCIDLSKLWIEYRRVTKSNSAIVLFSQMPFTVDLINSNRKQFRYEWIWEKSQGTGFLNANRMPLKAHENILVFYNKLPKYNPQFRKGGVHTRGNTGSLTDNYGNFIQLCSGTSSEYYPTDILMYKKDCNMLHPTQKPVGLLEYLIKTYTDAGYTVLDNTMGSGSTGVACVNTGRDFIGIELDNKYYDTACKRIAQAQEDKAADDMQMRIAL
jgi:site-specific DNA-methyltransferase (adenine-specific)